MTFKEKLDTILKRLLADVDDRMEFVGTVWQPKDHAELQVAKALKKAEDTITELIERDYVAKVMYSGREVHINKLIQENTDMRKAISTLVSYADVESRNLIKD